MRAELTGRTGSQGGPPAVCPSTRASNPLIISHLATLSNSPGPRGARPGVMGYTLSITSATVQATSWRHQPGTRRPQRGTKSVSGPSSRTNAAINFDAASRSERLTISFGECMYRFGIEINPVATPLRER